MGERVALAHARVLLHQPHGGMEGQSSDLQLHAAEILRQRRLVEEILARHTGQTVERIHGDLDRDFILGAHEAKSYGVIDDVLPPGRLRELAATNGHRQDAAKD